jgi:hypothetical protein
MIKVAWLAAVASLRVNGLIDKLAYRLQHPAANGKPGPVPREMYQTLLNIEQ